MRHLACLPILVPVLFLGACAQEPPPADPGADAERDIAMVEAANRAAPPLRPVVPEAITFADIDEHAIHGKACNVAPGTSLGTRVIAREGDAYIKVEGVVMRLAADAGSPELPGPIFSLYDGREYSLRLAVEGEGRSAGAGVGAINYRGTIDIRDRWGRSVYAGMGLAQCGG